MKKVLSSHHQNMDYFKLTYRVDMNEDKKKVYDGHTNDLATKLDYYL